MSKAFEVCFAMLALMLASAAIAQEVALPTLIKVVVPQAAGGGTDVAARGIVSQLAKRLGTNVIVENKPGASTVIGIQSVMAGPRDGSTLLFTSASLVSGAATLRNFPYDVAADLIPIAVVSDGPMVVVVSAKSGIKTPEQLIAAAKAKPDTLTAGSAGVGSIGHLSVELLNEAAKIQIRHIPYKGSTPALVDVSAGTIDMHIASNSTVIPHVQSGRAVAIAITSAQPSPAYPGIPTMATAAPGYSATIWYGLFAPAGTPEAFIKRLNQEVNEVAKSAEFAKILALDGASPITATPQELRKFVQGSFNTWKKLATDKNIVVD